MNFLPCALVCLAVSVSTAIAAPQKEAVQYELANVIKDLMGDKASGPPGYLALKKYVRNIDYVSREQAMTGPDYFPGDYQNFALVYRGEMPLYVNGRRFMAENMQDRYAWMVYIAGPNAFPSAMYIKSSYVASTGGPAYFERAGIVLQPIACEMMDRNNYSAFYIASVPGRGPIVLEIDKSQGSAGASYAYGIFWGGLQVKDLPRNAIVGQCDVAD